MRRHHRLPFSHACRYRQSLSATGRMGCVQEHRRRENDRFCALTVYTELNLIAAGHDGGLIVVKLERERPAHAVYQSNVFNVRDKYSRLCDYATFQDTVALLVRRAGSQSLQHRALSYSPAERAMLITSTVDGGTYEHHNLPKDHCRVAIEPSNEGIRGLITRSSGSLTITIRELQNNSTRPFKTPSVVNEEFHAGTGPLLLSKPTSVILFDIEQRRTVPEVTNPPVKSLEQMCLIHETIRLNGASRILILSMLKHIKYALPQGDNGIIRMLEQLIYLTRIKGNHVYCLDRRGRMRAIVFGPTQYRFKRP